MAAQMSLPRYCLQHSMRAVRLARDDAVDLRRARRQHELRHAEWPWPAGIEAQVRELADHGRVPSSIR